MPIEMPKGLPFSVDTWSPSSKATKRYHFLTHAHKDHSVGISSHSSFPIYCTRLTKYLLLTQLPNLDSSLFVEIEVGQKVVIHDPHHGSFSVTVFNANHCPGAVMFLFEGIFGNILHTGDCRLTPECLQKLPEKYMGRKGREPMCHLDYAFLDCTFGKSLIKMPSRHSAIRQVINCIWKHPNAPTVYLGCGLLGQEEILVEVSRTFGSKIYVDKINSAECFQALTLIAPDILSEDESCRFQVFEGFPKFYERAQAKLAEANALFQPKPLFIRPSAQWYACELDTYSEPQTRERTEMASKDSFGIWHVCYSGHSSREELEWALQLLQPKRVISTTPSCRATELGYVKEQSLRSQVTFDDPLWKLLDISPEVGPISQQAFPVIEMATTSVATPLISEGSQPMFLEVKHLNKNNISSKITLSLNLSSPSKRSPVTLFGRARLALEDSNVLQDEAKIMPVKTNPPLGESCKSEERDSVLQEDVNCNVLQDEVKRVPIKTDGSHSDSNKSEERESVLQEDVTVQVQCHESEDKERAVKSSSRSLPQPSRSSDESLRKLYRSMTVPVPKPLPSLVKLMESRKRAKRKFEFLS